jgi:hypothetical protein
MRFLPCPAPDHPLHPSSPQDIAEEAHFHSEDCFQVGVLAHAPLNGHGGQVHHGGWGPGLCVSPATFWRARLPEPVEQHLGDHHGPEQCPGSGHDVGPGNPTFPLQHLIAQTVSEPESFPFAKALPTSVTIPKSNGTYKAVIDNLISIILDDGAGCKQGAVSSLLAIHTVGRPVAIQDPIPWHELTAVKEAHCREPPRGSQDNTWLATRHPPPPYRADHGKVCRMVSVYPLYGDRGGVQL